MPIPIAAPLRARHEAALGSPGALLFPRRDGSMQPRSLRLGRMLRAALGRAGVVDGWLHRCRAPGCGHEARSPKAAAPERCPRCGMPTVWAKAIPRHVTFHGTRHSFGTAVVRGAGTAVAQKALRHSDVRLTIHTYGHLDDRDVREGIRRAFGGAPTTADQAPPEGLKPENPRPRTAGGLRQAAPSPQPSPPLRGGEGDKDAQLQAVSATQRLKTDARTAPSAASARTTCSWAA